MRTRTTAGFDRQYARAPPEIQRAFDRKIQLLLTSLGHPSLRAKRYHEGGSLEVWQARVNDDWRFYFTIEGDVYLLRDLRRHPKTQRAR